MRSGSKDVDMKSWISGKSSLIVLSTFAFLLYLVVFYSESSICDFQQLRRMIVGDPFVVNATKKILFWNTMFNNEMFYMGKGDIFRDCPVNNCYATHARDFADLLDFDAVLFHGNEIDLEDMPAKRSTRQWYVFVNLESPANRPLASPFFEDYFNTTMTYRLDSDVVWTYGTVKDATTDQIVAPLRNTSWEKFYNFSGDQEEDLADASLLAAIRGKTKPVAWFVSNCKAKSGREEYVRELSSHISVDIYGDCGQYSCPRSVNCFKTVAEPDYFFYLSFENSFCQDYVTEKLYNAFSYNVVPIVYGGANYSIFAPPRSYINALDFDSPEDLAEYLKWLIENPSEYRKHLEWKKYYKIDTSNRHAACNLCEFLHEEREPRQYTVLSDWYSRSKCPLQTLLQYERYITGAILRNPNV
ncbi:alpha-(1,3)-fucosyltransferase C-like [Hylaeus volcanicus]|uniref:alpha-(1,3)-fucosyltransferase C-like n=1 Tax=Hylaeus volcanicus TaxID=313075 RepID=UPI0023B8831B|nr:alpha-(1,3)-fucosyltransferase C-like [Hylaeus volcanicus]